MTMITMPMHNGGAVPSDATRTVNATRTHHCVGIGDAQDHAADEQANSQAQFDEMLHDRSPRPRRANAMMSSAPGDAGLRMQKTALKTAASKKGPPVASAREEQSLTQTDQTPHCGSSHRQTKSIVAFHSVGQGLHGSVDRESAR
jgi:hypothetical protein